MNTFNTVFNTPEIARKPFVYRSYELQTLTKNGLIQRKSPAQKIDTFSSKTSETKSSRKDQVKLFKGCLPQILLGPFLNNWSNL